MRGNIGMKRINTDTQPVIYILQTETLHIFVQNNTHFLELKVFHKTIIENAIISS